MFRVKTGLIGCSIFSIAFASYTVVNGPLVESNYMRYALAGTAATVAVEFATHGIDTLNMRSKAVESMVRSVLRRGPKGAAEPEDEKPKWTCQLDFDLRRHGRAAASEVEAAARAALRMKKK